MFQELLLDFNENSQNLKSNRSRFVTVVTTGERASMQKLLYTLFRPVLRRASANTMWIRLRVAPNQRGTKTGTGGPVTTSFTDRSDNGGGGGSDSSRNMSRNNRPCSCNGNVRVAIVNSRRSNSHYRQHHGAD